MLKSANQKFQHNEKYNTMSLGCKNCFEYGLCGGLSVAYHLFDCTELCQCDNKMNCDNVCPRKPAEYVARYREIHGFSFNNVPETKMPLMPKFYIPKFTPMIFHRSGRAEAPKTSSFGLSLYQLFDKRTGEPRFKRRKDLLEHFLLPDHAKIILTGIDKDNHVERWWCLEDRESLLRNLANLEISLITVPNFSLFNNVPRQDNLYNMKRIALSWAEIQNSGIPCALHLNARNDKDWERWRQFVQKRNDVHFISFEFATGARNPVRAQWYINHLIHLTKKVNRPLHLIIRGGLSYAPELVKEFSALTFLDANAFMWSQKRKLVSFENGKKTIQDKKTTQGETVDGLINHNIQAIEDYLNDLPSSGDDSCLQAIPA